MHTAATGVTGATGATGMTGATDVTSSTFVTAVEQSGYMGAWPGTNSTTNSPTKSPTNSSPRTPHPSPRHTLHEGPLRENQHKSTHYLPNHDFPSNHLPLLVEFTFLKPGLGSGWH